jgi:hypothetical protein
MLIIIFLMIGALFIISTNNLALKDSGNFSKFIGMYVSWLGKVFENTKGISSNVIKMDWLPGK